MSKDPPNVLFVVMDDQRSDFLGYAGHPEIQTPHIDSLAKAGTSFQNAFVTTPICTPARAELLTGNHSFHNGVRWFREPIDPEQTLLPQAFSSHGYHTIFTGKWHNDGHPREGKGFDRVRRELYQDNIHSYQDHGHTLKYVEDGQFIEGHSTDLFTDAFIEEVCDAPKDRPWFGWLAFHSPHDPFDCPEPWASRYQADQFPVPANFSSAPVIDSCVNVVRDELLLPFPRKPRDVQEYLAHYACMITHHDNAIGRLLSCLEESGQRENTLIVFTSDHGLAVGSHGFLGKMNPYDHSIRVPLIVSGPGIPEGQSRTSLVHHTDIYPTLCELCGVEIPSSVGDGTSMVPMFTDENHTLRSFVVSALSAPEYTSPTAVGSDCQLRDTHWVIRTEEWKLVEYPETNHFQLFNMVHDPEECWDLYPEWASRTHPAWSYDPTYTASELDATFESLKAQLAQWKRENARAIDFDADRLQSAEEFPPK